MMTARYLGIFVAALAVLITQPYELQAASKAAAGKKRILPSSEVRSIDITIKDGKKTRLYTIQCVGETPGKGKVMKSGMIQFKSFSQLLKELRINGTARNIAIYRKLNKSGGNVCKTPNIPATPGVPSNPNNGEPVPSPIPSPVPSAVPLELSLDKYTGPFGETEARILYNRFGFGGTSNEIADAVALGLEGTVNKLLTYVPEPTIDMLAADIECDGWRSDDPTAGNQNKTCSTTNVNDLSRFGYRTAWLFRIQTTRNPFFERLKFFIHDERMSVSQSAARDCERHAIRSYMNDLTQTALTGDYRAYMKAMNASQLVHLRWLDGASNQGGVVTNRPNENYAREFWELGTVGPTDPTGPVYTDLDVAQSSVALTGWSIDTIDVNGNQVCLASRTPLLHTPGMKTIFLATQYQSTIDNDDDLLTATFNHPRTSEHLAEDIWKQFINGAATYDRIQALGKIIRDNNYNLLPVFKTVMTSKAMFAPKSRNALVKHPLERVMGFLRNSGFPLNYRQLDQLMGRLEQKPLDPVTVFGWDEKKLAGDALMLEWRNVVTDYFININVQDLKEKQNFSYYDRYVKDLNAIGRNTTGDVIDRVSKELGVTLNAAQMDELNQYMNYYLSTYNCPQECGGQPFKMVRSIYDTSPDSVESGIEYNGQRKIRGLISAILTSPNYLVK